MCVDTVIEILAQTENVLLQNASLANDLGHGSTELVRWYVGLAVGFSE